MKFKTPKPGLNFYLKNVFNANLWAFSIKIKAGKKTPYSVIFFIALSFFSLTESLAQNISVKNANSPSNGISQGSLTLGQKDLVLFGFGVTATGPLTITEFNIGISSPDTRNNYFSNFRVYRSTDSIRSTGDNLLSGIISWKKNNLNNITIEGLSEVYADSTAKTFYYFLVADYTSTTGVVPGSIQFNFSSIQKANAIVHSQGSFNGANISGTTFNISPPSVEVSNENSGTNGISPALITFNQKNIVLFGFGVNVKGIATLSQFNLTSSNNIGSYFSNGRLYRSADNIYSTDDSLIASITINKSTGTALSIPKLAESFNWSPIRYYFFVADYTTNGTVLNNTIQMKFSSGQASAAIIQSSPQTYSYNTYNIPGQTFVFARTTIWLGNSDLAPGNWNSADNWSGGYVPGNTDIAYLGTQDFIAQPFVPSNASIGSIYLGTAKYTNLKVDSNVTLNAGDIILKATDASITDTISGPGTIIVNNFQLTESSSNPVFTTNRISKIVSTISNLTASNLILRSKINGFRNDAAFELSAGSVLINGLIQTINANTSNTSTFIADSSSILNLISATPFNRSAIGMNIIRSVGKIIYKGASAQNVDAEVTYNDLGLAGSGIKTINANAARPFNLSGTLSIISPATIAYSPNINGINIGENFEGDSPLNSGILPITIAGNWTNTASGFVGGDVTYLGTDQIAGAVDYTNVTFINGGVKQLSNFSSVKGNLEVGANTLLQTNDKLILKADSTRNSNIKPLLNGADISGKVTVQSFIKGGSRGYIPLSSPVYDAIDPISSSTAFTYLQLQKNMLVTGTNGPANGFDLGSTVSPYGPTIRRYREEASPSQVQYYSIGSITERINTGNGFNFYFRGNRTNSYYKVNQPYVTPESVVLEYFGNINKGNINVPLSYTNYNVVNDDGFNLVGNPYPSVIDLQKLLAPTPFKVVWIIKQNNTYAVYDVNLGTGTNGASQYIIPGQGFFVQANQAGQVLQFTEESKFTTNSAMRVMGDKSKSVASTSALAPKTTITEYIKLQARQIGSSSSDETIIAFKPGSSSNKTAGDARYWGEGDVLLGSLSADNELLAINYLPKTETDTKVKLQVSGQDSGTYSISLAGNFLSDFSDILLTDNYLNKTISLKSDISYTFLIDKSIGTTFGNERFYIIFRSSKSQEIAKQSTVANPVSTEDSASSLKLTLFPNPVLNQLHVKLDKKSGPIELTIYNLLGQPVNKAIYAYSEALTHNVSNLSKGSFILELRDSQSNSLIGKAKFIKE